MRKFILLLALIATPLAYGEEVDFFDALEGGATAASSNEEVVAPKKAATPPAEAEPTQTAALQDKRTKTPEKRQSPTEIKAPAAAPAAAKAPAAKESDKFKCGKNYSDRVKSASMMFKEVLGIDNPFKKQLVQNKASDPNSAYLVGDPSQPGQSLQIHISDLGTAPAKICKMSDGKLKIYGVGQKSAIIVNIDVAFAFEIEKRNKTQVAVKATASDATTGAVLKQHSDVYNIQTAN